MSTEISTNRAGGLALQTMGEAMQFAQMVAKSDFAPKDFKGKPESCLLAIQHGSEVGLSPMQSLQSIACINGRPSVWGDAALALVMGSTVCEYVRERVEGDGDAMVAICERAMAREPSRRYADMIALADDLLPAALARADEVNRPLEGRTPPGGHPRNTRIIPKSRDFH